MNINKNLSDKPIVSPRGEAHWAKINSRYDDFEGKKKYCIDLSFDKETEAKMKKKCDAFLEKAKSLPEFADKKWSADAGRGYKEEDDGTLRFHFQTRAFYTNRQTGEEVQRVIPVLNTETHRKLDKNVAIGNGSEVRVLYTPGAYWSSARSNGVNLYLSKLAVDKLVVFGDDDNFDEFGEKVVSDEDEFSDMNGEEEEIPF